MTPLTVGKAVLVVVDIQQGAFMPSHEGGIPLMPEYAARMRRACDVVDAARAGGVPIVFLQEIHRRTMVDFGRELDGSETVHCLEGDPGTPIAAEALKLRADDIKVPKRRYSGFFGTDLEIVLKGLKAQTLLLVGGLTDVCVHYTFADAHQHDYVVRVVEDCVAGSSVAAHEASLNAMEYLQTGARRSSAEVIAALSPVAMAAE